MAVAASSLATLDEIKDYYQFGSTKQIDDDLIEDLSDRVTEIFQIYCGVTSFYAADYTEVQDGRCSKYMFLNNLPVNSVSEVNEAKSVLEKP